MVFVGSAVVINTEGHLTLTFFVDKLPHRIQRSLKVVANLIVILILILIFIKEGAYLTQVTSRQISATVGNKMSWVYAAIPVGGVLMVLNTLRQLVKLLKGSPK
jgi:TRAP-type C4-dicarboxylate transport system permease small subunit